MLEKKKKKKDSLIYMCIGNKIFKIFNQNILLTRRCIFVYDISLQSIRKKLILLSSHIIIINKSIFSICFTY